MEKEMKMKTIRRDKLLRLARAGKLVAVNSYHFDDMHGASRGLEKELPVVLMSGHGDYRGDGFYHMREHDFKSTVGRAWESENGTITLYIHSNSNVTLRVKES